MARQHCRDDATAGDTYWDADDDLSFSARYAINNKEGGIRQLRLDLSAPTPSATPVRQLKLATQTEGCVVDQRTATLYVGEEDVGIWRFSAHPGAPVSGELVVRADGQQLVTDVEGLALAPEGDTGGWLVASSQGDNAYAGYHLPELTPAGRFRIAAGRLGAPEETDGIELKPGGLRRRIPLGIVRCSGWRGPRRKAELQAGILG